MVIVLASVIVLVFVGEGAMPKVTLLSSQDSAAIVV